MSGILRYKDKKSNEPCIIKEVWSHNNKLLFKNEVDSSKVLPDMPSNMEVDRIGGLPVNSDTTETRTALFPGF